MNREERDLANWIEHAASERGITEERMMELWLEEPFKLVIGPGSLAYELERFLEEFYEDYNYD